MDSPAPATSLDVPANILAQQIGKGAIGLTAKDAAALLGLSLSSFYEHVAPVLPPKRHGKKGTGPARWRLTDLETYNQKSNP